jgi:hypothetical protein
MYGMRTDTETAANNATDQELETFIDTCMMELMANIDEDCVIQSTMNDMFPELNAIERVYVFDGPSHRHVFAFYGGTNKCIRAWHNWFGIQRDDVGDLERKQTFVCLLVGPLTPLQKAVITSTMEFRAAIVIAAITWLKTHNAHYGDVTIPTEDELVPPLVVDLSEIVDSDNETIEMVMKYTVVLGEH